MERQLCIDTNTSIFSMTRFPIRVVLYSLRNYNQMATKYSSEVINQNTLEKSFKLPWGVIAGKLWGNPESEKKILAVHGWLENAGSFDRLAPLLFENVLFAQKYSIFAIDLAGHGLSSHRDDGVPYSMIGYVLDIKHVLNQLGWKKFSILGHSLGGAISTLLSIGLDDEIEHLMTLDSVAPMCIHADQYLNRLKNTVEKASTIYSTPDGFKTYPTQEAILARILEGNVHLNEEGAKVLAIRGAKPVEDGFTFTRDLRIKSSSLMYFLSNSYQEFANEIFKHVSMPTLHILPTDSHMKFRVLLPELDFPDNFTVKFVPGNHHTHTNTPEVVAPTILEFLNLTY